jgi:hypothetical protein
MEVKAEQPENTLYPILVTLFPRVTEVKLKQPLNVASPILVTLLGIVMEVNDLQPSKKPSTISHTGSGQLVIFSDNTTDFRLSHP